MAYQDFREFLGALRRHGELIDIDSPIALNPIFQGLLTGKPVTENHILKQIPFEASFYATLKRQFPTVTRVSLRAASSVPYYVVIAMKPRFAGEARQAILAAMSSNIRPK